jgi:hypothetical protein
VSRSTTAAARRGAGDVWSYDNIHGDVMAVAGHLGI